MRLLLDECVDRRLAGQITGHEVATVVGLGWAGVRNGALLARAAGRFDVFVTVDRNLAFQQRIDHLPFAVVVFARSNESAGRSQAVGAAAPTGASRGSPR